MRPLVAVRRAVPFDPSFLTRHPLFWPLVRPARALGGYTEFPPIEALVRVFDGDAPVRFVRAPPRRRRRAPLDARALYDARITLDREVPTRSRCWHDMMNALVWGAFPLSKQALHARQYRAVAERLSPGARRLPPARTPELDALALLDEGGVVLLPPADDAVVFGHAIYESLVFGVAPAVVAAIALAVQGPFERQAGLVGAVDRELAHVIEDERMLCSPRELRRVLIESGDR
jgi:hypothetical protein